MCAIRAAMEDRVAELRRVATGKHQAEEQIVDLQRRILELNRPESAGKDWDDEQVDLVMFSIGPDCYIL